MLNVTRQQMRTNITTVHRYLHLTLSDTILSAPETTTLLDISMTRLEDLVRQGALTCRRYPGGQRKFWLSEVLELLEGQGC